jgi:hypothetical protein
VVSALRGSQPKRECASEMVVKAILEQQKISEVPVVLYPDGRNRAASFAQLSGWVASPLLVRMCPRGLYIVPVLFLLSSEVAVAGWGAHSVPTGVAGCVLLASRMLNHGCPDTSAQEKQ